MRVAVLGRTRAPLDTIPVLIGHGHHVVLIATAKPAPEYEKTEADFRDAAERLRVPYFDTRQPHADLLQLLNDTRPDVGVSVNWPAVLHADVIDRFPFGILNLHAGDLPQYRGNAPVAWSMLNGDSHVGVCVHLMTAGELDSGPVVRRASIPIADTTYIGDVLKSVETLAPVMFLEAVNAVQSGDRGREQDQSRSLRCYSRRPIDGAIRWHQSAADICRLVRVSSEPFMGAFAKYDDGTLLIWRAQEIRWPVEYRAVPGQVLDVNPDGSVAIACRSGVLRITEVSPFEGRRQAPANLIRSTRARLENGLS